MTRVDFSRWQTWRAAAVIVGVVWMGWLVAATGRVAESVVDGVGVGFLVVVVSCAMVAVLLATEKRS